MSGPDARFMWTCAREALGVPEVDSVQIRAGTLLIGMASACDSMDELRHRVALRSGKHMVQLRLALEPPK